MKQVAIIGGGLAGLVSAIQLCRKGISSHLFEKKKYPFHRVCGEYISGESAPFLKRLSLYPDSFNPPEIKRLEISSIKGDSQIIPLDLGGFGISRFAFDNFLYHEAVKSGVEVHVETEIQDVTFQDNSFQLKATNNQLYKADIVIGAQGKRSTLDATLGRSFMNNRSPFVGIKYHVRTNHTSDVISLHNFPGGYCGISNVENGVTNLCYLTDREKLRISGGIEGLQEKILFQNPLLREIFKSSEFIFSTPVTINEVSFETKLPVEHHILMAGDAAGMITPLCGNGMSMALQASEIVCRWISSFCFDGYMTRKKMEDEYSREWNRVFKKRLWAGRQMQRLFGNNAGSSLALNLVKHVKPLAQFLIKTSHGKPF